MNKQGKLINGKVVGGIEWTKRVLADGTERQGFTWNVAGGCLHECQWIMPDGSIATCYAKEVALGVASQNYPEGFEHHYWHPDRLNEPLKIKAPSNIFLDSMADLMGYWVGAGQIDKVFETCRACPQHTFQLLTKNAPRLLQFDFPANVWVGVSSPPDYMWGNPLAPNQQAKFLERSLDILQRVKAGVRWMSFEPLSQDYASIVARFPGALQWAVIGAASNGSVKYQPDPDHVQSLLDVLDRQGVPVFFKGNLKWQPWREGFPQIALSLAERQLEAVS